MVHPSNIPLLWPSSMLPLPFMASLTFLEMQLPLLCIISVCTGNILILLPAFLITIPGLSASPEFSRGCQAPTSPIQSAQACSSQQQSKKFKQPKNFRSWACRPVGKGRWYNIIDHLPITMQCEGIPLGHGWSHWCGIEHAVVFVTAQPNRPGIVYRSASE